MNFQKYTEKAQEAVQAALALATEYGNTQIEPEHLLLALLEQDGGVVPGIMQKLSVPLGPLTAQARGEVERLPRLSGGSAEPRISTRLNNVATKAETEAKAIKDEFVSTEHLLLAIVDEGDRAAAAKGLKAAGVTRDRVLQVLSQIRGSQRVTSQNPEATYDALKKYGRDLTELAEKGKLDPVIGRDEEIRRVIQVLSRRTKNNPVLIGEPGVGKTAIVEGLALRIVRGDVPEGLKNRKLIALDLGSMVAGAKFRGEFEERLKAVLKEITEAGGEIIVFIDELHTVVGAGAAEGAMDASNMLKPMLARGELHMVGATTLDEYRKHIEKDAALERRFQPVFVGEPTVEDTISILRGLRERYEVHHGVRITDSALVAAAVLSNRYISDRFLPDKAIDLVDEAASRLRMENESMPVELDQVKRRVMQLEIERQALSKEKDAASKDRLQKIEQTLGNLKEEERRLTAQLQSERAGQQGVRDLKEQIERANAELEAAQRNYDLNKAAELQYGRLPELQRKLDAAQTGTGDGRPRGTLLREEVTDDDIAAVVSKWTGIPVTRMLEGELAKLLRMEERLHLRVVGQEEAIAAVANAVRRSRAGLQDPNRPLGSFLFLGPTGVGKTELARALAEFLFDDENAIVRIDMSEYTEKFSVSRLMGAPPGYVGYEEGGQLTEQVRRRPYSVVLFDEIEKAHPEVFNVFLQILDDGRLTDSQGRIVDFKNTVIIMTSNVGSQWISELGATDEATLRGRVQEALRQHFRPEFLNRVDETVIFQQLSRDQLARIVDIQMERVRKRLAERKITLALTDAAKEFLGNEGFDPVFGARPLKRTIQRRILDPLSLELLEGHFRDGDTIHVAVQGGQLVFRKEAAAAPAGVGG
ncbi:MAG TPA: ATP-dependent chaperone ClpB [Chloroflexia bacterium]|nr:ATP-dependent chaperone ClpB [Chloroflexia bacterium]